MATPWKVSKSVSPLVFQRPRTMLFIGIRCAAFVHNRRAACWCKASTAHTGRVRSVGSMRRNCGPGVGVAPRAFRRSGRFLRVARLSRSRAARDSDNAVPAAGELFLRPFLPGTASTLAPLKALWPDSAGLAAAQRRQAKDQVDLDIVLLADDLLFDRNRRAAMGSADCRRAGRSLWDVVCGEAADRTNRIGGKLWQGTPRYERCDDLKRSTASRQVQYLPRQAR